MRPEGRFVEADVCVIGGGPAGLAAALAARRRGLSVVVADRSRPPVEKACGEGLMPEGVAALRELGVDVDRTFGMPFRGIRFLEAGLSVEATFPDGCGLGIRRLDLHRLLWAKAEDAGVVTIWGSPAERIGASRVEIAGRTVRCRWIIGADGAHSCLRQQAGLPPRWTGLRRIGLRQHFRVPPWTDFVEVYWRHEAQAYVTPVATDEVCVAVLGGARGGQLADLGLFPELAKRLGKANRVGPVRGAISMSTRLAKVTRDPFALIGDASGAVDAVTGEGVSLALRQALALGQALATHDLDVYETAHRRMSRLPLLAASVLVHLGAHDAWRRRVLETLAAHPPTFERLLAVHVGAAGSATGARGIAGLTLRLIQPRRSLPLARAIASSEPADLWRPSR